MGNLLKWAEKTVFPDRSGRIVSIEIEKITPNPLQPRKSFDVEALLSLAESIRIHGILQPIAVRRILPLDGKPCTIRAAGKGEISLLSESIYPPSPSAPPKPSYEIVVGERRFRAAQLIGLKEVPCLLLECDRKQSAELAIIENIQRQDLNPFEEAAALASLLDLEHLTQEQLASRLSVSQAYVANKLRLLRLGAEERSLILTHRLSERHARALLRLEDGELRLSVLRTAIARGYNVTQTETLVRSKLAAEPPSAEAEPAKARKSAVKDMRIFYNTIEHAIETIAQAGVEIVREKRECGEAVEYLIRFPKAGR